MPLKKCTVDGQAGYQWGEAGKCYTGPDAKKKAIKQGVAIEGPKKFSQKAVEEDIVLSSEDIDAVASFMYDEGYSNTAIVATVAALSSGKTKKEWDKIDKEELKHDTKKEKKEHEKDAIKDDKDKIKRLEKDPPSDKKKREVKDLKKDEKYDKRDAKSASDRDKQEHLERKEYRQDKDEMDHETLHERLKHHKDAVKNLEREIRDLKKDKKEDETDVRRESKGETAELADDDTSAVYEGCRTTSFYAKDREGYGHFHTFTKGATETSRARTRFGDLLINGHFHEIVDGKIMPADGHTHTMQDIGPGDGWVYGD